MKYVMFQFHSLDRQSVTHVPVIFPEMLSHKAMAEAVTFAWHNQMRDARMGRGSPEDERRAYVEPPTPVSAGFLDVRGIIDPSRGSETLKLMPHPADEARINTWRYTYGQF